MERSLCDFCKKKPVTSECGHACRKAQYCGQSCADAHYSKHKPLCIGPRLHSERQNYSSYPHPDARIVERYGNSDHIQWYENGDLVDGMRHYNADGTWWDEEMMRWAF